MVSKRKKKYSTGEGAQFVTRKAALKKLQLSLNDFRRLCIIKGIYPREPRNRKRAQQGDTSIKTLYHTKDINFLLHEPIIDTLRILKTFNKRVGKARATRDTPKLKYYLNKHPVLKLDHVVKERYPTFVDALRDLDDCLTLCFLFSTFPAIPHLPRDQSGMCQRLTMEFLQAVIEAKALRKVFVSIKGYYFQAEFSGEQITWIVPHHFSFEPQSKAEVDFRLMSTFVEFYVIMLGFVNFRLYNSLNLYYPPKFGSVIQSEEEKTLVDEGAYVSERIAALNFPLAKTTSSSNNEEEEEIDNFTENKDDSSQDNEVQEEAQKIKTLKTLFKGLKFFLNREVPREPLVFIIRCFGGQVSWDRNLFLGATFGEDCADITHQICDRPSLEKRYITRYYVQPQWLFDSVNQRTLLPVNKYFLGEVLPPHLSPFIDKTKDQQYIPPEERALYEPEALERLYKIGDKNGEDVEEEQETGVVRKSNVENRKNVEDKEDDEDEEDDEDDEEDEEEDDENSVSEDEKEEEPAKKAKKLKVTAGEVDKEVPWEKNRQERHEFFLREKLVKNKHRKLYKSMMEGKKKRAKEIWLLRKKRRLLDEKKQ